MSEEFKTISTFSEETLKRYRDAFNKNGSPKSLERLLWMHKSNPIGVNFIELAVSSTGETAAVFANLPVKFKINNKIVNACQAVDAVTDKNYRKKGLFVKLVSNLSKRAKDSGYSLVYATPNPISAYGFFNRLNYKLVDDVPFIIKPLRSKYFTEIIFKKLKLSNPIPNFKLSKKREINIREGLKIKNIDFFSDDFTNVWEVFSDNIPISLYRNAEYLNWRYIEKSKAIPGEAYNCKALYDGNKLLGYIIYTLKEKHGGKIAYIMEHVFLNEESGSILMQVALNDIIEGGADAVLAWCFSHSPSYPIYKEKGFFTLPQKLRPIKLFFGVQVLNSDNLNESFFSKKQNWYLSYSDSDTV